MEEGAKFKPYKMTTVDTLLIDCDVSTSGTTKWQRFIEQINMYLVRHLSNNEIAGSNSATDIAILVR
jgi:hypothetical protein